MIKAIGKYVCITYKNEADVRISIEALERMEIPIADETVFASNLETRIWRKEVNEALRRRSLLKQNSKTLFSLVWG